MHTLAIALRVFEPPSPLEERACKNCLSDFTPSVPRQKFCGDRCAYEYTRDYMRRKTPRGGKSDTWESLRYEVVHDPDPCGGFGAGARLDVLSVEYMRALGAFSPGTILLDRKTGERVRV